MAFGRRNIILPLAALAGLFASYKLLSALYRQYGKKIQTRDEPPLPDEPFLDDEPLLGQTCVESSSIGPSHATQPEFHNGVEGARDENVSAEDGNAVPSNPPPSFSLTGPKDETCATEMNMNGCIAKTKMSPPPGFSCNDPAIGAIQLNVGSVANVQRTLKLCCPPGFSREDKTIERMKRRIAAMKNALPLCNYSDIVVGRKLGSGTCGKVYEANTTLGKVALKILKKKRMAALTPSVHALKLFEFYAEATVLAKLNHPHILKLRMMIPDLPSGLPAMGTEFLSRDLFYFIHNTSFLQSYDSKWRVVLHVADAMAYLHSERKMVHFDLKSSNILLDNNSTNPIWKVADFGLAMKNKSGVISLTSQRGTTPYMAPEVILADRGVQSVTEEADVYSFGILMWELISGKEPYEYWFDDEIENYVLNGDRLDVPICDVRWKRLMEACWRHDMDKRPSFRYIFHYVYTEIFGFPW